MEKENPFSILRRSILACRKVGRNHFEADHSLCFICFRHFSIKHCMKCTKCHPLIDVRDPCRLGNGFLRRNYVFPAKTLKCVCVCDDIKTYGEQTNHQYQIICFRFLKVWEKHTFCRGVAVTCGDHVFHMFLSIFNSLQFFHWHYDNDECCIARKIRVHQQTQAGIRHIRPHQTASVRTSIKTLLQRY